MSSTDPSSEKNGNTELILSETKYIATQGPKDGHFSHFWHMVMQETVGDVGVIVMLTTCYEGNKEKCSQYFPASMNKATIYLAINEAGEDDRMANSKGDPFYDISYHDADTDSDDTDNSESIPEGGPVKAETEESPDKVTLLSVTQDAAIGCEVRKMTLEIGGESKTIYHYLFSNWPDYGKPEAEDRKALLELVKQSAQRTGRPDNPRFVHCSAGVGRTGTFIALDHLLQELENGNLIAQPVNADAVAQNGRTPTWGRSGPARSSTPEGKEDIIYDTVDKLREQRMMMVMNELQFCFLYEVLKEAFIEKYARKPGQAVMDGMPPKVPRRSSTTVAEEVKRSMKEEADGDVSEAETDVMDVEEDGEEKDPYDAVAPESIRQGQEKTL
jgi:protein-tyrosine phosphatase